MINDELLAEAKKVAADRQESISKVVNDALRLALRSMAAADEDPDFQIPTYRPKVKSVIDTTPAELDELLAAEDAAPYLGESRDKPARYEG